MSDSLYDIPVQSIEGEAQTLGQFKGKVLLVVNVASKCGLTPQYEGLEALYEDKRAQGLEILGFPANNFKGQEPGSDDEIKAFCTSTFDVQFPMFSKISVVGEDQHPLYKTLTTTFPKATGDGTFRSRLEGYGIAPNPEPDVLWNFEKFLIGRDGTIVNRFSPDTSADAPELRAAIDAELAKA